MLRISGREVELARVFSVIISARVGCTSVLVSVRHPSLTSFSLFLPQLGLSKSLFVNNNTTAVYRSVQIID